MDLKDYREKELKQFALVNTIIFILIHFKFKDFNLKELGTIAETTLFTSAFYILILLIDGVISSDLKNKMLTFWNKKPLPAETIFSEIKKNNKDKRFNSEQIKKTYTEIYTDLPEPEEERRQFENEKWYDIYGKHRDSSMIRISHRDYLLMRDMYVFSVVSFILYFLFLIFKWYSFEWQFIIYLVILVILTRISAKNKAKRFVYNVIAIDISEVKSEHYN